MVVKSMENSQFFWWIGAMVIVIVYSTENKGSLYVNFREPFPNEKLSIGKYILA